MADQIPFTRGVPSADLLPVDDLRAAAVAAFETDPAAVLSYAPAGYPPLRRWIAERHGTTPDRVVVVNGSLEGVDFLARHLFGDGQGTAIVEEPTYDRTLKVLRAHGARIEPVPLEDDGPDLDRLEELLGATPRPRAVYLIPTYQNPSGLCTSLEKRRAIVAMARERGVLVIEDDPYGLLRFEGEPLPSLHELDGGENVIHSSSFTKTIAPGVRTGYLLLPERLVDPLRLLSTNTTIAPNTLAGAVVAAYCEAGRFEPNVARVDRRAAQAPRRHGGGAARGLPGRVALDHPGAAATSSGSSSPGSTRSPHCPRRPSAAWPTCRAPTSAPPGAAARRCGWPSAPAGRTRSARASPASGPCSTPSAHPPRRSQIDRFRALGQTASARDATGGTQ